MADQWELLQAEFPRSELKFLPGATGQGHALALVYVDARAVMDRLDEVCGPDGWTDEYTVLPDGAVECRLSVFNGATWHTKADCGYPNGDHDKEPLKGAYSDALKRAAVRWGIGRYLYSFPQQWLPYDSTKKRFKQTNEEIANAVLGGHLLDEAKKQGAKAICAEHGIEWTENPKTKKRGHQLADSTEYHVEEMV